MLEVIEKLLKNMYSLNIQMSFLASKKTRN